MNSSANFPALEIIINGGIKSSDEIAQHLEHVDGVMMGREAYHNPYAMADYDARFYGDDSAVKSRQQVLEAMIPYIQAQLDAHAARGLKLNSITRHMLGLMAGLPGARSFRQIMSDPKKLASADPRLLLEAAAAHAAGGVRPGFRRLTSLVVRPGDQLCACHRQSASFCAVASRLTQPLHSPHSLFRISA